MGFSHLLKTVLITPAVPLLFVMPTSKMRVLQSQSLSYKKTKTCSYIPLENSKLTAALKAP